MRSVRQAESPCSVCFPSLLLAMLLSLAGSASAGNDPVEAISPEAEEPLFNGRDLSGWQTWLKGLGQEDPQKVFQVVDGTIRVSGEGQGYLATHKAYRDYHLSLEYKWGERHDGSGNVRNSGVLLHATGPHGGARGVWMSSIECQLAQGCEGDLIVIRGKDEREETIPATISSETTVASDGRTRWQPGGTKTVYSGKQFWWSRHQPGFRELRDTRGKDDVASPLGQWTRVECICAADRITIKVNGVAVNGCFDVYPRSGRILLQNEGNEIFFRNVVLRPLAPGSPDSPRD